MEFLEINDYEFLKANCRVRLFEPEEETSDYDKIRMSILNQAVSLVVAFTLDESCRMFSLVFCFGGA